MVRKKYLASEGIAFSEKKDLQKLREYAAKGWNVKRYKRMGYELEEGPKEDVIFNIDVNRLTKDEEEEYFEMFQASGWEHVCSSYNTHLFKAKPGTAPIYTDKESEGDKFNRLLASITPLSLYSLLFLVIATIGKWMTSGIFETIFHVVFMIAIVVAIPCVIMYVALSVRKLRLLKRA